MNRRRFLKMLPASLLALLPGLDYMERNRENNAVAVGRFMDVEGRWGELVNRLRARGIVEGDGQGCFMPHRAMTRAEAAVVICRLAGLEPKDRTESPSHWGHKWATTAYLADYMEWFDIPTSLDDPATRADVAVIAALALDR